MRTRRALLFLSLAVTACAAANIDEGFAQDGVTTYCQGVRGATTNPLEFLELEAHNAGRCPIDVKIDVKATTVGLASPTEVQWAASVHSGDVPNNIFPRAVDPTTKKPQNVIASILRACKAGTNCALDGVVVPQVVGPAADETGAFDAQGRKTLRTFRFQFPAAGHYVIVGIVVLPGDAALNVSASEFLAFQRVTVVDGGGPATVSPAQVTSNANASASEVGAEGRTDNIDFQTDLVKQTTAPPAAAATDESGTTSTSASGTRNPSGVNASFAGTNKSGTASSGSDTGSNKLTMMLAIGAVVTVLLAVLLYFVVIKRRNRKLKGKDKARPLDPHSEAGIFRLTLSGGENVSSLSLGTQSKQHANSGASSMYSAAPSRRSLAPPRYTNTSSQDGSSSVDSGPFGHSAPQSEYPSFENAALTASGKEFRPHQQPSRKPSARQPSIVSLASSTFSDFDDDTDAFADLHDSAEALPVTKRKTTSYAPPRGSAASSAYSYGGGASFDPRGAYDERDSAFGGSRRSTELGALSECESRRDQFAV